jgi:hypothetical protein
MEAWRLSSLPRHHVRAPAGLSRCPSLSGGASGRSTESHQRQPAHRTRTHARSGHRRRRRDSREQVTSPPARSIDPCTVRATPTRRRTPFRIKSLANGDRGARLACLRSTAAGWVDGRRALAPSARRRKRQRPRQTAGCVRGRTEVLVLCGSCRVRTANSIRSSARFSARTPHAKGNPIGVLLPTTWRGR